MATTLNLTGLPNVDMVSSFINIETGPETPFYRTIFTPVANQAYSAISGSGSTTITVTMPQISATALVFVQLSNTAGFTGIAIAKTAGTGFVITLTGSSTSAGTADILIVDFL